MDRGVSMAKINLKEKQKQKEKKIDRGVNRAKIKWKQKQKEIEPTEMEYMMMAIAELDTQREADKTENEMAVAELAEAIMGGM